MSNGIIGPEGLNLRISRQVYEEIETFSASDPSRELGGILLGSHGSGVSRGSGVSHGSGVSRPFVIISGFIEANHTVYTAASLTFTHETWQQIHQEKDRDYPGLAIVGWHHTHPNYGVFLSQHDLFIHQNFFNLPFQVAYVVDPLRQEKGFFYWLNGQVVELPEFYIV